MRSPRNRGLTLLEMILALAILGVLAVLTLSSLTVGARGFMSSRADVETTQRARLALTRMAIELRRLTAVSQAQPTSIRFTNSAGAQVLEQTGNTITLNGDLLIENLASYPAGSSLFAYRRADGVTDWTTGNDLDQLYEVIITLRLTRPRDPVGGDIAHVFTTTLNPRNTGAANTP
ncbi:MAG: type II secretion system protein [Thermodesulfobacteriota bacterium]